MMICKQLRTLAFIVGAMQLPVVAHAWLIDREDKALNEHFNGQRTETEPEEEKRELSRDELRQLQRDALTERAREIQQIWPKADFSDHERWVTYTDDLLIRRIVNFQRNEIEITLPKMDKDGRVDFTVLNERALNEVIDLLGTTIEKALQEDPLNKIWEEVLEVEGETLPSGGPFDHLVLSELFRSESPTESEIERVARMLMGNSFVTYESRYAFKSVDVPLELDLVDFRVPLPSDRILQKAKEYQSTVAKYSEEHNVPENIIFAVIHTESHFNPLARSSVPAYGLMQIVPRTAGKDASQLLYSKKIKFSANYLYNPENNIKVGTAYLRMVYYRYLKDIKDPKSRLYCTIAAYNTGAANVARAFIDAPQMTKAIPFINRMSSEEVLEALLEKLPARQTKDYLRKVLERAPNYEKV